MKLEYIKKENITDIDILDNITDNCNAILLYVDVYGADWWIEINPDGSFYVSDGWIGTKTNSIENAIDALKKVIKDNTSNN
jgi:hypothetical protein